MINKDLKEMFDFVNKYLVPLFDGTTNVDTLNISKFCKETIKEKRKYYDLPCAPSINDNSDEEDYEKYVDFYASMIGTSISGIWCITRENGMCNNLIDLVIRQAKFEFEGETEGKINNPLKLFDEPEEYYLYICLDNKMDSTVKYFRYSYHSKEYIEIKEEDYKKAKVDRMCPEIFKADLTIIDENTVEIGIMIRPLYGYGEMYKVINIGDGLLLIDPKQTWIS